MEKRKLPMYMLWEGNRLKCACSFFSPLCSKYQKGNCQEEVVIYDPCQGINECMKHSSYKRIKGSLRQK